MDSAEEGPPVAPVAVAPDWTVPEGVPFPVVQPTSATAPTARTANPARARSVAVEL